MADAAGKQVVARAASVLEALEGQTSGLSLGEIAKATGLPKSTVQRLVAALETQSLVVVGQAGVRLGPTITRLAASIHTDVVGIAARFIQAAARRTRETVDLSVFRGIHALSVFQCPSDRELRVVSPIGAAFPAHSTAHGKAALATLSDADIRSLLLGKLDARTERTITEIDRLLSDIASIRSTGISFDREEHEEGVCAIGASLNIRMNEQHAISIAVPTIRFERNLAELRATLMKCKAEIESQFGEAAGAE